MIYTIKTGHHRCFHFPKIARVNRDRIYKVVFHSVDNANLEGVNKLIGFSNLFHSEKTIGKLPFLRKYVNSLLVGWKYYKTTGRIHLYEYKDENGIERRTLSGIEVRPFEPFYIWFGYKKGYLFLAFSRRIGDDPMIFGKIKLVKPMIGYMLFPYFGGKSVAPSEIVVQISEYDSYKWVG